MLEPEQSDRCVSGSKLLYV